MNNFFFNVANWDNGRTWSTPWVIDDPKVFVIPPPGQQVANLYRVKKKPHQKQPQLARKGMKRPNGNSRSAPSSRQQQQR
jgi:hypothetical protein